MKLSIDSRQPQPKTLSTQRTNLQNQAHFDCETGRIRVVTVGRQGLPAAHVVGGSHDVDLTGRKHGSLLQFDENTEKYMSTNDPWDLNIDAGEF